RGRWHPAPRRPPRVRRTGQQGPRAAVRRSCRALASKRVPGPRPGTRRSAPQDPPETTASEELEDGSLWASELARASLEPEDCVLELDSPDRAEPLLSDSLEASPAGRSLPALGPHPCDVVAASRSRPCA